MSWGEIICISHYGELSNLASLSSPPWPPCILGGGGDPSDLKTTNYQRYVGVGATAIVVPITQHNVSSDNTQNYSGTAVAVVNPVGVKNLSSDNSQAYDGTATADVGGAFDADYQEYLNQLTTDGITAPSAGQQVKQNQLVLDLKAANAWGKLDFLAIHANDGSSGAGVYNLIDPSNVSDKITLFNSPTFIPNQGFKGNGTSAYMTSNWNPKKIGNNYGEFDCNLGYYCFTADTGATNARTLGIQDDTIDPDGGGGFYDRRSIPRVNYDLNFVQNPSSFIASSMVDGKVYMIDIASETAGNSDVDLYEDSVIIGSSSRLNNGLSDGKMVWFQRPDLAYVLVSSATVSISWAGASLNTVSSGFVAAIKTYMSSL